MAEKCSYHCIFTTRNITPIQKGVYARKTHSPKRLLGVFADHNMLLALGRRLGIYRQLLQTTPTTIGSGEMSDKAGGKPKSTGKKSGSASKSKSGGSSYLVRQSKASKVVTEEELRTKDVITPEDVMALAGATKGIGAHTSCTAAPSLFLCLVLHVHGLYVRVCTI